MVFQEQFTIASSGHGDMHDLTEQVAAIVTRSKVRTGVVQGPRQRSLVSSVGKLDRKPGVSGKSRGTGRASAANKYSN